MIEAELMMVEIDSIKDPKECLIKLSACKTQMGWGENDANIRGLCYGAWLKKNKPDWYEFFVASTNILNAMFSGGPIPDELSRAPEGWIPPIEYFKGVKDDAKIK